MKTKSKSGKQQKRPSKTITANSSRQEQQNYSLALRLRPFVNGLRQIQSMLTQRQPDSCFIVDRVCLTLLLKEMALLKYRKESQLSTQESAQNINWMIWDDKSIYSEPSTLEPILLQTLRQALISKGKGCRPYWNWRCAENSQRLWLPTKIDYVDSEAIWYNGSWRKTEQNSSYWHRETRLIPHPQNKNSQPTFSTSSMFTHANKWDEGAISHNVKRVKKIRLYLTKHQKHLLNQWVGTTRYVWNKTLGYIKDNNLSLTKKLEAECREKFITANTRCRQCSYCLVSQKMKERDFQCPFCELWNFDRPSADIANASLAQWETDIPKDIRDRAQRDLFKAYNSSWALFRAGHIDHFNVRFKSKKDDNNRAFEIGKENVHLERTGVRLFKTMDISSSILRVHRRTKLPAALSSDARIKYDGRHYWLMHCVETKDEEKRTATNNGGVVALDPGVRKFQTFFSSQSIGTLGRDPKVLKKYHAKIDLLQRLRDKKQVTANRIKRQLVKAQHRLKNIVTDMHIRIANYLCSNYNEILLPEFGVSKMVQNLGRRTNRLLMSLGHYRFKQRLLMTAERFINCRVFIVNESYTSMTCNAADCGLLSQKTSEEVVKCQHCHLITDRDCRGARGIYLKHIA